MKSKNINFNIEVNLKEEFDLKVKNDKEYKNSSDAINKLIFDYINENEDIKINQGIEKKLTGFLLNSKAMSLLHFFGNNTENYTSKTHLIREVMKYYIKKGE